MTRKIWFIADDYGISPAVSEGIFELLQAGRLSGTGCMTVFPDWLTLAKKLAELEGLIGLHITLTDQPALTGPSTLAPEGKLRPLQSLYSGLATGLISDDDVNREIDAQIERFAEGMNGRTPDFIDGHQHVHFLPAVRRWMQQYAQNKTSLPWLRGAPASKLATGGLKAKNLIIRATAAGFDAGMKAAGYRLRGPLYGIYDWRNAAHFAPVAKAACAVMPDGAVFMCHPGRIDAALSERDGMIAARPVELEYLNSDEFRRALEQNDIEIGSR